MVILGKDFRIFVFQPFALDYQQSSKLLGRLLGDYLGARRHTLHAYLRHAQGERQPAMLQAQLGFDLAELVRRQNDFPLQFDAENDPERL